MTNPNKILYFPDKIQPHSAGDGIQKLYRFDNGYGASVIRFINKKTGRMSDGADEGLWELSVIMIYEDGSFEPCRTLIGGEDSTIGWLREGDVQDILKAIENLPPHSE